MFANIFFLQYERQKQSRRADDQYFHNQPLDPTYQYKDVRGRISTRRFVTTQQRPFQEYIVTEPPPQPFCTARQLGVCCAVITIIVLILAGLAAMFGIGKWITIKP